MAGGRPRKFDTVEQLETLIEGYFDYCDNYIATKIVFDKEGEQSTVKYHFPKPYTVSGLCAYLGITRDTLSEYQKQDEFSDTIKTAKTKIEAEKIEGAMQGKYNPAITIFDLKNNHNMVDKTEVDNNVSGGLNNTNKHEVIFKKFSKDG